MTKTTEPKNKVVRTSSGLRDAIFDELDALRNGESNPTQANAVSKLTSSIVDTVRMELDVQKAARAVQKTPVGENAISAITLGG